MRDTDILIDEEIIPKLASSYYLPKQTDSLQNDPPYYIQNYYASGAMYSTVEDLYKFDQALFNGKLLKAKTLELMLTPYPNLFNVAYGFWVSDVTFNNIVTKVADRQGAIMGSNTTWAHLIKENITVIIFSNTNATNINEMREKLILRSLKK
jgi:CubicO group peptidase (beta-lactamase class C family)